MPQALANAQSPPVTLVAIGANATSQAGDARETILASIRSLQRKRLEVEAISQFFSTPAYPPGSGSDFVNAAIAITTPLTPAELLAQLHVVEAEFGRTREIRWGARTLDLDLLAMGDLILPDAATLRNWIDLDPALQATRAPDRLLLPHPRIQDRGFVLVPLAGIAPGWRHPLLGRTVSQMLADLPPEALEGIVPIP